MPHRKTLRRRHEPGDLHELTFSTYRRKPLLTNDRWRGYFCEALTAALPKARCGLVAWVVMPEHVHLLILPERSGTEADDEDGEDGDVPARLSALLAAAKRAASVRVKADLRASPSGARLLEALTVRERPGKTAFRFWQEGAGYDRNLRSPAAVAAAIAYLHANPVRRGLVTRPTDWFWSSARRFADDGEPRSPPAGPRAGGAVGRVKACGHGEPGLGAASFPPRPHWRRASGTRRRKATMRPARQRHPPVECRPEEQGAVAARSPVPPAG